MPADITETTICNQALSWVAGTRILALDDGSTNGDLCNDNYFEARDATLESAAWTFATVREMFDTPDSVPAYGYANSFNMDPDNLRVLEVRSDNIQPNGVSNLDWRKEGDAVATDANLIFTKSIFRITDPLLFSTLFRQTLAARLAAMLSPTITESNTKTAALWSLYGNYLHAAMGTDGSQGKSDRIRGRSLISKVR